MQQYLNLQQIIQASVTTVVEDPIILEHWIIDDDALVLLELVIKRHWFCWHQ